MRVYIIKKNKIKDMLLPEKIEGNYWIVDYDKVGVKRNIINIEASEGKWNLVSNSDYFCYNHLTNENYSSHFLREYNFLKVKDRDSEIFYDIYCAPIKENFNYTLKLSGNPMNEYFIGRSDGCNIRYDIFNEIHATLKIEDNILYIVPYNDSRVFVNNLNVISKQMLYTGDIIFIEGLKIIPKIHNNEILILMNNPGQRVTTNIPVVLDNNVVDQVSFTEPEDDIDMKLYTEDDYFHKSPRFVYNLKPLELSIDPPPDRQDPANMPLILTVGPMLTMSISSLMTCFLAITNVTSGKYTWTQAIPSLVTSGVMCTSVLLWPTVRRTFQKSMRKKREKLRQEKYLAYIEKIKENIKEEIQNQQRLLKNKFPSIDECRQIINNRMIMLWERSVEDEDFLSISLGYGNMPMFIDIKFPEEHFTLEEDNLLDDLHKLRIEPKILMNVPIALSLQKNNLFGIVGNTQETHRYFNQMLLQLITHHSYSDLKLVLFTDDELKSNWDFMKVLPHCWNDDKTMRYFATNTNEYNEVCYILENIFNQRKNSQRTESERVIYDELYLIIIDNFKSVRNYDLIDNILKSKGYCGFSLIILNDKITTLPEQCKIFVDLHDNKAELVRNISNEKPFSFFLDNTLDFDIYSCAKKLANIPIEGNNNKESNLPTKVGFLEMYGIGKVESFNCKERWKNSNPMLTLQAPVGYAKNGELLNIDLHEKYHGPHGIIAGMTGSGKSEFIITFILSLAVNYHPYEVQFILIDYKGGGIAGAFENATTGIKLPHLIGAITNLDVNEIDRSFASIESELKRRQRLFNHAREVSGESTVDIYKYQRMYREGVVKEPISHLFIISDEFAELKSQQPEFMQQLISIARIGRSLGIHLILATQKPSGVVDAQIWSNTRFRVCLRVQEKADSKEVIQCPDAAFLKQTGRFYFQVGYNEVFNSGQAAWAGGKYFPSEMVRKEIDTNINYIGNVGYIIKNIPTKKKVENVKSEGEELNNIVKYIVSVANDENVVSQQLWKDKIPAYINIVDIIKKYNFKYEKFEINIVVGEYDAPRMQSQYLLTVPFSSEGNVLLYGATGSGKENFISTMIYSSMLFFNPSQLNYYLLDFGSQSLNMFKDSPLVGDIMNIDTPEKIDNLIKLLNNMMETRKQLFANYNGDYLNYCEKSGNILPAIIVVINNYEVFQDNYSAYEELLVSITRDCIKYGIYFLLACSTPSGIKFKLKQNFNQIYSLQQNSIDDYISIFGNTGKKCPSKLFGRGIIKKDFVYEFQTAFIDEEDKIISTVKELSLKQNDYYKVKAKYIPVLPNVVDYESIKNELDLDKKVIFGMEKESLSYYKYDLNKEFSSIITGNDSDLIAKFVNALVSEIAYLDTNKMFVVNCDGIEFSDSENLIIVDNEYDAFVNKIYKFLETNYKKYLDNNSDKTIFNDVKPITCVIVGISSFDQKLKSVNKIKLDFLVNKGKELGILNFIVVDTVNNLKKVEINSWYKAGFTNCKTVWIGPGINEQYVIKIANRLKKDITDEFALVVSKGKYMIIKYLSHFKVK